MIGGIQTVTMIAANRTSASAVETARRTARMQRDLEGARVDINLLRDNIASFLNRGDVFREVIPTVVFNLGNSGRSVANITNMTGQLFAHPRGGPGSPRQEITLQIEGYIPAGDATNELQIEYRDAPVRPDLPDLMLSGRVDLLLSGRIEYEDAWRRRTIQPYFYRYHVPIRKWLSVGLRTPTIIDPDDEADQ
jgi:hypothetical protein